MSIFLIGPMGAGKTTMGRQLAKKLRLDFYDSDKVIEERTGATIPLIFELEGEAGCLGPVRRDGRVPSEFEGIADQDRPGSKTR